MADRVGQQLGNYRLVRLLGRGGFAEVYLGIHIHLETEAAIKVLHTQLANEDVEQFRTEARLIARLIHPHIVRVLEFGVEGVTPFLVMDYAPGGTLRTLHPKGSRLTLSTVVSYVKQVAPALQYAHEHKLIHRDIKPENLLVGRANEILLSDFGIALVTQSSRYQSTRDMAGTIAYMAPEQIEAHPRPASDQYALGIVVYEWLSGERPFHGSFTEIAVKHSVVPPPSLREKVPGLSLEVEQVLMTTLAKDPQARFFSVQAFATALEQASQIETSAAIPESRSPQPPHALTELHPSQQPTGLTPPLGETFTPTELITPANQSPPPTKRADPIAQSSLSSEQFTPASQRSLPTEFISPPGQSWLPTQVALPTKSPAGAAETLIPHEPAKAKRGISRRTFIVGLAGTGTALVVGGGLTWLAVSRKQQVFSQPTSTPSSPIGTTLNYTYYVDGPSMLPGLYTGEHVRVDTSAYLHNPPQRGDVIVFHYPLDPSQDFIKRVIGLPGDTIKYNDTTVWVNGVQLKEPYVSYPGNPGSDTLKVPPGDYFVMGDNRPVSDDSRDWGFLPSSDIVGKGILVCLSTGNCEPINTYPSVYAQIK